MSSDLQQQPPDRMGINMTDQAYSLKWSNHTENIITSLQNLLQAEELVDVTLMCGKESVRAHRLILSVCSPFFKKIFSETPCNHPVVVLHDFKGDDVRDLMTFMYKGEVSVEESRLRSILKSAEGLQIRGLGEHCKNSPKTPEPVHAVIYEGDENGYGTQYMDQRDALLAESKYKVSSPSHRRSRSPIRLSPVHMRTPKQESPSPSPSSNYEPAPKQTRRSLMDMPTARSECRSPTPRRKQARPRRCSADNSIPQDLSLSSPRSPQPQEAQNLCIKKSEPVQNTRRVFSLEPLQHAPDLPRTPEMDVRDYRTSPLSLLHPQLNLNQEMDNHPHLPFPPMPSVSALTMTPPQGKYFGLDSQPLGLFPPGLENCRSNFFEMDHRGQEQQGVKKKSKSRPRAKRQRKPLYDAFGRPKGQHSAPRGGPPRSWTNSELTEALQHVWNKKMTTSQASRVFGIPYNSLLMYVRGKYGKSLKLEQLRKDCIGSPNQSSEHMAMNTSNNNNTVVKSERDSETVQPNTRPPSTENPPAPHPASHPAHFLNPFISSFYQDFGNFSLPIMHQFLPHPERAREHFSAQAHAQSHQAQHQPEIENSNSEALDEDTERFRSPTRSVDERRDVVQNGQN